MPGHNSSKNELQVDDAVFRNMFENHSAVIYIVDLSDFSIIDANQSALDFYGYDRKTMLTKRIPDLNTTAEDEIRTEIQKSVKEGRSFYIFKHRLANGEIRDVEIYANPVKLGDRELSLSIVHDITERIQAEKVLADSREVLAKTERLGKVGSWEFNIDTGKQIWSKGVYDIHEVDYDYDPTVSKGVDFYTQDSRSSITSAVKQAVEQSEPFDVELEIKTAKGNLHKVHAIGKPDLENRRVHGFFQDITERKIAETLLKESNEELDAFVQTVAHDLRSPITPIIGYAEILRENYKGQLDEQGLSYLSEIEKAGAEMLSLMESLLSLARAGTLIRPIERVSTDEVVARVIKNLGTNITSTGVVLQVNPMPSVRMPKAYLTQIFDNLISNAIRYAGKKGGLVEVGGEQTGKQKRFFVRDHGPGISEQERKHIFEIFYRGTNKGKVKGSGIGLAIVYKIARICGGRAWVEETHGGGCTFWVEVEDVSRP